MTLPLSVWTTGRPVPPAERRRGSFFAMIRQAMGTGWYGRLENIDVTEENSLPEPGTVSGVIITGSPARIGTRDPWMLRVEAALRDYRESQTPVLGICFGHQLMGMAFGGAAGPNPNGREIGTPPLRYVAQDGLIRPTIDGDEPVSPASGAHDHVVMTHLDSVTTLPEGAVCLAETELEPNAAVRFSDRIWGVQFHPEMDAEIVGDYLQERRQDIEAEGLDVDRLLGQRVESAYGRDLLRRFVRLCLAPGTGRVV